MAKFLRVLVASASGFVAWLLGVAWVVTLPMHRFDSTEDYEDAMRGDAFFGVVVAVCVATCLIRRGRPRRSAAGLLLAIVVGLVAGGLTMSVDRQAHLSRLNKARELMDNPH